MITFFSHCRPFEDEFDAIQRAAVASWLSIDGATVVLMGRYIRAVAEELGAKWADGLRYNEYDTATIGSIFEIGERWADHDLVCEISSDIVVSADIVGVLEAIKDEPKPFVVGQRTDLLGDGTSVLHKPSAVDYFIYRRGTLGMIPGFAVGRTAYDNWLVWAARYRWGLKTIDATADLLALHYPHGYPEYGSLAKMRASKERRLNMELARVDKMGGWLGTNDTEYVLVNGKIEKRS